MGFDDPKKYLKEVLNLYLFHLHKTDETVSVLMGDEVKPLNVELLEGIKNCKLVFFNAPSTIRQ